MRSLKRAVLLLLIASIIPACGGSSNDKPPLTLAVPPTTLIVTPVSTARIDVSWTDNSDNEFSFNIWRSDSLSGPFVQIASVPMNTQTYSDLGLLPSHQYFYEVTAWNSRGDSAALGPLGATTLSLAWTSGPNPSPTNGGPTGGFGNHSAVYDSLGQRMLVFGGLDDGLAVLNTLWALDLSSNSFPATAAWTSPTTSGTAPFRYGHSAIYDSANGRMVVFGGQDETYTSVNEVNVLDLMAVPPAWSKLIATGPTPTVTGTPPTPRLSHTAVYDSLHQQMIVFGGDDGGPLLSDVHVLSLPGTGPYVWSTPPVSAGPEGRYQHAAIYDPIDSKMVTFGGIDQDSTFDGSTLNNETWTLQPPTWSNLLFPGTPSFRSAHSAIYDAANRRMVVFGGATALGISPTLTNEVWALGLGGIPSWSILNPAAAPVPAARYGHSAVYDTVFNRMVVFGGFDPSGLSMNEVWVIKF